MKLKQGGQTLTGKLIRLDYARPDADDYTTSTFSALARYPRDVGVADQKFEISTTLFDYLPNAQTFLSINGTQKLISAGNSVEFDPEAVTANLANNVKDFAILGAEHIFGGYDHLLFILALLLTATSFWTLAKTLTGFTIAHSITLILSALSVISLDGRFVEIAVAASIVFVGLENIYWKNAQRHRFWVASGFGLIHGVGFSGVLREIGLPQEGLAWCLLSFNLGVEIAQMMIYYQFLLSAIPKTHPDIIIDTDFSLHGNWPLGLHIPLRRNGNNLSGELAATQYSAAPIKGR